MIADRKTRYELLVDSLANLWAMLRAALPTAADPDDASAETSRGIHRDFEGWLHGDPSVTKNPSSRYGDRTPGYITGNGLGSMEIGAADD